jgi:hypothetical protein
MEFDLIHYLEDFKKELLKNSIIIPEFSENYKSKAVIKFLMQNLNNIIQNLIGNKIFLHK